MRLPSGQEMAAAAAEVLLAQFAVAQAQQAAARATARFQAHQQLGLERQSYEATQRELEQARIASAAAQARVVELESSLQEQARRIEDLERSTNSATGVAADVISSLALAFPAQLPAVAPTVGAAGSSSSSSSAVPSPLPNPDATNHSSQAQRSVKRSRPANDNDQELVAPAAGAAGSSSSALPPSLPPSAKRPRRMQADQQAQEPNSFSIVRCRRSMVNFRITSSNSALRFFTLEKELNGGAWTLFLIQLRSVNAVVVPPAGTSKTYTIFFLSSAETDRLQQTEEWKLCNPELKTLAQVSIFSMQQIRNAGMCPYNQESLSVNASLEQLAEKTKAMFATVGVTVEYTVLSNHVAEEQPAVVDLTQEEEGEIAAMPALAPIIDQHQAEDPLGADEALPSLSSNSQSVFGGSASDLGFFNEAYFENNC